LDECIFCKIVAGEIPSSKLYEDDEVIAFRDISPQAPVHVLVVPKKHISGVNTIGPEDTGLLGHVFSVIQNLVCELGVDETGYRVVVNSGKDGQQSVPHLHFHVLGGRSMEWPPG